jgi:hypothetical protein
VLSSNLIVKFAIDFVGWLGAALVLTAYAMVSFRKLNADSGHYQLLNVIGSFCLIVNTIFHHAYPSALVNIIWILIAILAFLRTRSRLAAAGGS